MSTAVEAEVKWRPFGGGRARHVRWQGYRGAGASSSSVASVRNAGMNQGRIKGPVCRLQPSAGRAFASGRRHSAKPQLLARGHPPFRRPLLPARVALD